MLTPPITSASGDNIRLKVVILVCFKVSQILSSFALSILELPSTSGKGKTDVLDLGSPTGVEDKNIWTIEG